MSRFIENFEQRGIMPEITPGEVVHQTEHYSVVTDFKPGMEGDQRGARFFIEPRADDIGLGILLAAAKAHNIYNFNIRSVITPKRRVWLPALRADYTTENLPPLLYGQVDIPQSHGLEDHTIPSPDRMEACIRAAGAYGKPVYSFQDGDIPYIPDPMTRHLRLMFNLFSDTIPDQIVHSSSPNKYFKARKNWFVGVMAGLEVGIHEGEFTDPVLIEQIEEFMAYIQSDQFKGLTKKEDIEWANSLIRRIIGE